VVQLSSAAVLHDGGAKNTLVWFGGLHEPFLNPAFLPPDWNCLTVVDERFDWYMEGIAGLANNFEDTAVALAGRLCGHRTVYAGQSSGGYAALRFCEAASGDLCIAFAPQTHNVMARGSMRPWVDVIAVDKLLETNKPSFPIVIHLSRSERESLDSDFWDDWQQIARMMALPNVTIVNHPFHIHALSLKLAGEGRFYKAILGTIGMYF
jgi:hypothetical protein